MQTAKTLNTDCANALRWVHMSLCWFRRQLESRIKCEHSEVEEINYIFFKAYNFFLS